MGNIAWAAGLILKLVLVILENRNDPVEASERAAEVSVRARNERLYQYYKGVKSDDKERTADALHRMLDDRLLRRMQEAEEESRMDQESD